MQTGLGNSLGWRRLTLRCGALRERNHDWSSAHTCPRDQRTRHNTRWQHRHPVTGHASARDLGPRDRGICPNRTGPVVEGEGLGRLRLGMAQTLLWRWLGRRLGLAQVLLWRRRTRGRSYRRPRTWDARGWRRVLLWLRLPVFRVRVLSVFLRVPVLLLLPELLRNRLLRDLVWPGLWERLLGFGQAGPETRPQARAPLGS